MTEPTVLLEERGAVAVLTLNRPQALNALDLSGKNIVIVKDADG